MSMVLYKLASLGIPPSEAMKMDMGELQEILWIDKCLFEKEKREMERMKRG